MRVKLLERLVNIDSGTGYAEGSCRSAPSPSRNCASSAPTIEILPAKPAVGDNIVATFNGTGKGRILLMAHIDTVFAQGTAAKRPFRIDGGRAYGPGVSDDKGGIVTAMAVLKILQDLKFKDYARITLLLNTNEETGSRGSRALIERLAREHDVTLNLESGRAGDGIVIWRKGSARLTIEVKGRAAHAGGSPEQGRNAAMELANQVLQVAKLGNAEKQTTVNVTVLQSGDRSNVIPDLAVAHADVRALVQRGVRPRRARGCGDCEERQAHSRHRGDGDAEPQLPGHAAERADRRARQDGAVDLRRARQDAEARRQRRRGGFELRRGRVQAGARRAVPSSAATPTPTGNTSRSPAFCRDSIC